MPISRLWLLVLSLQPLVLSLPRPEDSRPRLRAPLGRGVDPQLLLLLLPRVYLLPRGQAGIAWGEVVLLAEVVLLGAAGFAEGRLAQRLGA